MHLAGTLRLVGAVLILSAATGQTASASKHHVAHFHRHAHPHAYGGFGRFDPDNYGVYGGPETGFFAGPSYGPVNGYVYY